MERLIYPIVNAHPLLARWPLYPLIEECLQSSALGAELTTTCADVIKLFIKCVKQFPLPLAVATHILKALNDVTIIDTYALATSDGHKAVKGRRLFLLTVDTPMLHAIGVLFSHDEKRIYLIDAGTHESAILKCSNMEADQWDDLYQYVRSPTPSNAPGDTTITVVRRKFEAARQTATLNDMIPIYRQHSGSCSFHATMNSIYALMYDCMSVAATKYYNTIFTPFVFRSTLLTACVVATRNDSPPGDRATMFHVLSIFNGTSDFYTTRMRFPSDDDITVYDDEPITAAAYLHRRLASIAAVAFKFDFSPVLKVGAPKPVSTLLPNIDIILWDGQQSSIEAYVDRFAASIVSSSASSSVYPFIELTDFVSQLYTLLREERQPPQTTTAAVLHALSIVLAAVLGDRHAIGGVPAIGVMEMVMMLFIMANLELSRITALKPVNTAHVGMIGLTGIIRTICSTVIQFNTFSGIDWYQKARQMLDPTNWQYRIPIIEKDSQNMTSYYCTDDSSADIDMLTHLFNTINNTMHMLLINIAPESILTLDPLLRDTCKSIVNDDAWLLFNLIQVKKTDAWSTLLCSRGGSRIHELFVQTRTVNEVDDSISYVHPAVPFNALPNLLGSIRVLAPHTWHRGAAFSNDYLPIVTEMLNLRTSRHFFDAIQTEAWPAQNVRIVPVPLRVIANDPGHFRADPDKIYETHVPTYSSGAGIDAQRPPNDFRVIAEYFNNTVWARAASIFPQCAGIVPPSIFADLLLIHRRYYDWDAISIPRELLLDVLGRMQKGAAPGSSTKYTLLYLIQMIGGDTTTVPHVSDFHEISDITCVAVVMDLLAYVLRRRKTNPKFIAAFAAEMNTALLGARTLESAVACNLFPEGTRLSNCGVDVTHTSGIQLRYGDIAVSDPQSMWLPQYYNLATPGRHPPSYRIGRFFHTDIKTTIYSDVPGFWEEDVATGGSWACESTIKIPTMVRQLMDGKVYVVFASGAVIFPTTDQPFIVYYKAESNTWVIRTVLPWSKDDVREFIVLPNEPSPILSRWTMGNSYRLNCVTIVQDARTAQYVLLNIATTYPGRLSIQHPFALPSQKVDHIKSVWASSAIKSTTYFGKHQYHVFIAYFHYTNIYLEPPANDAEYLLRLFVATQQFDPNMWKLLGMPECRVTAEYPTPVPMCRWTWQSNATKKFDIYLDVFKSVIQKVLAPASSSAHQPAYVATSLPQYAGCGTIPRDVIVGIVESLKSGRENYAKAMREATGIMFEILCGIGGGPHRGSGYANIADILFESKDAPPHNVVVMYCYSALLVRILTITVGRLNELMLEIDSATIPRDMYTLAVELIDPTVVDYDSPRNVVIMLTEIATGFLCKRSQFVFIEQIMATWNATPRAVATNMIMGGGKTSFVSTALILAHMASTRTFQPRANPDLLYEWNPVARYTMRKEDLHYEVPTAFIVTPTNLAAQTMAVLRSSLQILGPIDQILYTEGDVDARLGSFVTAHSRIGTDVNGMPFIARGTGDLRMADGCHLRIIVAADKMFQKAFLAYAESCHDAIIIRPPSVKQWIKDLAGLYPMVIYDEIDTQLDPITCQMNIPREKVDRQQFNAVLDQILRKICDVTDQPLQPRRLQDKIDMCNQVIRKGDMVYNRDYGFGSDMRTSTTSTTTNDPNIAANHCTAIPYVSARTPANGSRFTDVELWITLTLECYRRAFRSGLPLRYSDFEELVLAVIDILNECPGRRSVDVANGLMFLTPDEIECVRIAADNWFVDGDHDTLLTPELFPKVPSVLQDAYARFNASVLQLTDVARERIANNLCAIVCRKYILPQTKELSVGMLELMSAQIAPRRVMFSGTLAMRHWPMDRCPVIKEVKTDEAARQQIAATLSGFSCKERSYVPQSVEIPVIGTGAAAEEDALFETDVLLPKYSVLIDCAGILRTHQAVEYARRIAKTATATTRPVVVFYVDENGEQQILDARGNVVHYDRDTIVLRPNRFRYFYLYAQKDTIGIDFRQPPVLHALVTISAETTWTRVAQAVFRLRKLGYGHSFDYCTLSNGVVQLGPDPSKMFEATEIAKCKADEPAWLASCILAKYRIATDNTSVDAYVHDLFLDSSASGDRATVDQQNAGNLHVVDPVEQQMLAQTSDFRRTHAHREIERVKSQYRYSDLDKSQPFNSTIAGVRRPGANYILFDEHHFSISGGMSDSTNPFRLRISPGAIWNQSKEQELYAKYAITEPGMLKFYLAIYPDVTAILTGQEVAALVFDPKGAVAVYDDHLNVVWRNATLRTPSTLDHFLATRFFDPKNEAELRQFLLNRKLGETSSALYFAPFKRDAIYNNRYKALTLCPAKGIDRRSEEEMPMVLKREKK